MTIAFVLALLKIRFVSLDHLEIEWISISILLIHECRSLFLHAWYNVVSSAYWRHIGNISATHRLNNIGPNIEPCGTPNSDVKRVEKCASICTKCCRKVK